MASLGVELWIASLADIPASLLVSLEKNLETKTQDTSGQKSKDLLPDEHKKLFEDLEGTAQSIKFFNHVLSSLYFPSNQKSVRKS